MLAVFDVGNTRVAVGLFQRDTLRAAFSLATDVRRTAEEYQVLLGALLREEGVSPSDIRAGAISSVVPPLTETFQGVCERLFKARPLTVGAGTRTGIRINIHNPREVGTDRIVNAVAAYHLCGGPSLVVDFGTATAFDVIGRDGTYQGSAIAPGLALSAEALFQGTSRLQRVDLVPPRSSVGKDTAGAVQSGLVFGHVAMVQGMVARIQADTGEQGTVVATGQLAPLVAQETSCIDRVEPHLALLGLRLLYERNRDER